MLDQNVDMRSWLSQMSKKYSCSINVSDFDCYIRIWYQNNMETEEILSKDMHSNV